MKKWGSKIIYNYGVIENCNECAESYHDENAGTFCEHDERAGQYGDISVGDIIPDWCPLPNLEDV